MVVKFYTNSSERDEIYKSLSNETTLSNVIIKDDTNITDPVLILSGTSALANNINYAYIQTFGRYYFIDSKEVSQQRIYLTLHVDVLESARTQLLSNYAILGRSTNHFNAYQIDEDIPRLNNSAITITPFEGAFVGESLIMTVAGGTPTP